jgi:general secretion pathway protein A
MTAPALASAAVASAAAPAAAPGIATALPELLPDERSAWRELGVAWQLAPGDGDPCVVAQKRQLQCYRATLSLALVRQLDRPGIVSLRDERQRIGYALLTGLGTDTATLQVEGAARQVPLAVLARAWRGEFATLWKSPPGFPAKASEAAAGPLVDWLNAQLQPPLVGSDSTDLKSRVYAFQVAQGLRPDGLAGPTTFMQLNRALGIAEPRLKPAIQP